MEYWDGKSISQRWRSQPRWITKTSTMDLSEVACNCPQHGQSQRYHALSSTIVSSRFLKMDCVSNVGIKSLGSLPAGWSTRQRHCCVLCVIQKDLGTLVKKGEGMVSMSRFGTPRFQNLDFQIPRLGLQSGLWTVASPLYNIAHTHTHTPMFLRN